MRRDGRYRESLTDIALKLKGIDIPFVADGDSKTERGSVDGTTTVEVCGIRRAKGWELGLGRTLFDLGGLGREVWERVTGLFVWVSQGRHGPTWVTQNQRIFLP